ncbi:MAG: hypothetical protein AB1744_09655, partial [Candidatus Zixiibacteriota bacterium]
PTEVLAGWAAALMIERAPRFAVAKLDLNPIRRLAFELDSMERRHKIATSGFAEPFEGGRRNKANLGAAAVYAWAGGKMGWRTLVATSGSEEGDMQRLISQTAEVLRQLEDLPLQISEKAGLARLAIMRYPVGEPEQGPEKA